jgi:FtsP/CotA-like multicopper oxidase with cupredoxin domain
MIQDRSFNADGSFRYRFDLDRGFRGDTILVNGAVAPRMKVERRLYRLRFPNASNARSYKLELGNGRKMIQIGSDGGLLPGKPVARTQVPLESAERVDVIVDFRQFGVGSQVILHNTIGEPSTSAVMRFDVVRGGAEEARIPKQLAEDEKLPEVNMQRSLPLRSPGWPAAARSGRSPAAGLGAAHRRAPAAGLDRAVDVGQPVLAHTPDAPARLPLPRGVDRRVAAAGDAGWKDTVAVYPQQTVVVRPDFDYYTGVYVFHCHAAEHGDISMMGQMEVVA